MIIIKETLNTDRLVLRPIEEDDFESLKLRRIQAPCAAVNYGSCRVMEHRGV